MKLSLFFLLLFNTIIFAGPDTLRTYYFDDIVISATRTEIPLLHSASSITIIDSAEIVNSGKVTVFDLLKTVPGLTFTQQGGPGKLAYINMRGANTNHTLLLIDGIEMNMTNDPSNTYDFSYLSPDNISRIEVLRGPQSTLYGSDAVAGVINIITRKGSGKPSYTLSAEGGSYGTYKGSLGLNGSLNKINYSLTYTHFKTNGFSAALDSAPDLEKDGSTFNNFTARIGADLADNFKLSFISRYVKGKSDYDQFVNMFNDDPTYVFNFEESANRLEGDLLLFDGKWQQIFGISHMRNIRKYSFDSTLNNPSSSNSHYDGSKIKLDWQNNFQLDRYNLLTFGFEAEREYSSSEYFSTYFNSLFGENFANNAALFLQNQVNIDNSLFAAVGIRYDKHNKFGSAFTYRIAPAYIYHPTGTKIKFSVGNSFKAPSIFYLFDPAYGNPGLKPEKNNAWDAGIEQFILDGQLSIGVTYFRNSFSELFGFDPVTYKTININKAESYGVEFSTGIKFSEKSELKMNYTYTKAYDLTGSTKMPLLRRPVDKLNLQVNTELIAGLNTLLEILVMGERDDMDYAAFPSTRIKLKKYTVVNLSASYSILKNLDLFGRIDNLFDYKYEEIYRYGTPGFSAYAGFRVKL